MPSSCYSLTRLAALLLVIATSLAVGVARLSPRPETGRRPSPAPVASVNSFFIDPCTRGSLWFDVDGGTSGRPLAHNPDEVVEYAACSPWVDGDGLRQVVGRWSWASSDRPAPSSYGLFRVSYPGGEVLDHVETEVAPISLPCWYPGIRARVLFAAGDGKLYQYDFERPAGEAAEGPLREITWACTPPFHGRAYLADPCWSTDPRFGDLVLVGLRDASRGRNSAPRHGPTQLWWLRLGHGGSAIVDAGPLVADADEGPDVIERCPTIGTLPDASLRLAYFRWRRDGVPSLHLADVEFDPAKQTPRLVPGSSVELAKRCLTSPPLFSADGRWVGVVQAEGPRRSFRRFRIDREHGDPSPDSSPDEGRGDRLASRLVDHPNGAAY